MKAIINSKERFYMTRKILTAAAALLCVALIIFIFSNSLDSAKESTEKSDAVYETVNHVAQWLGMKKEITRSFIRQSAHFLEFTALGAAASLTLVFALAPDPRKRLNSRLALSALSVPFCALIALTDEYIQTFSVGRVFDVVDILTDTSGSVAGSVLTVSVYLLICLICSRRRRSASAD